MEERYLVTGPCGQDGRILINRLLSEKKFVGAIARTDTEKQFLSEYAPGLQIFVGDLNNRDSTSQIIGEYQPSILFHLAAKSSVAESWNQPELTHKVNFEVTQNLLEILDFTGLNKTKFYFSASSEMFGSPPKEVQCEETKMIPISPYAKSKFAAFSLIKKVREETDRFLVSGILFNHESPLRDERFVTRKITKGVARILEGLQDSLTLGDLSVTRDWGWAPDFVDGMLKIIGHDEPKDYLLATGVSHSLENFVQKAFALAGIDDWESYVKIDDKLFRKSEVKDLKGDASRAWHELGWKADKSIDYIISQMLEHDICVLKQEVKEGFWKPTSI